MRRPASASQTTQEACAQPAAKGTRGLIQSFSRLRMNRIVQKSKVLLSWRRDEQVEQSHSRSRTTQCGRFRGLGSTRVLELVQPRPSLSPDLISRPMRPGSHHTRPSSHVPRSEVEHRISSSRPSGSHPPRFGSVIRSQVPRYSTVARPTHRTVIAGGAVNFTSSETPNSVNDRSMPHTPPPAYSRFDPGLSISEP